MLHKLFGARTRKPPAAGCHVPQKSVPARVLVLPGEKPTAALKIIHAGGKSEYYYMAVPAARIMEKYPSFVLARPDVFCRPWESRVRPDEILVPGQKYFVVPRRTMKKLRRRTRKPSGENSIVSEDTSGEVVSVASDVGSTKTRSSNRRHVRFFGIDCKKDTKPSVSLPKKKRNTENEVKVVSKVESSERPRRLRHAGAWEPSLTVISESEGSDE
ncbi:hypothetical protein RJ639_033313 [Escallonia herrerae]|uniref:Uncharacterized protein n=1 Tax=Escallonia herrerae TaxID=1293975 RepID=A0AA88WZD5_9ASTE|nr:hypothetical protein RJ639_033313 [Escallonia herrerae]